MNYPFILKFTAVKNLSDARYAAGNWADFVGFNFDPQSSDYIEPVKAKEIAAWINGPILCGEFSHQPIEWIYDFAKLLSLQALELPDNYPFKEIFENKEFKFIIRVKDVKEAESLNKADIFITDDSQVYHHLKLHYDKPVILEIDNLDIDASVLDGLAFKGGIEDKPGTRNQIEWTEFLEKWEA